MLLLLLLVWGPVPLLASDPLSLLMASDPRISTAASHALRAEAARGGEGGAVLGAAVWSERERRRGERRRASSRPMAADQSSALQRRGAVEGEEIG